MSRTKLKNYSIVCGPLLSPRTARSFQRKDEAHPNDWTN